ncbi:hypothetical protein D3C80_1778800 [compost metagenome]
MARVDAIKAFRTFKITFTTFRAQAAGEIADRERVHQAEFIAHFGIQLQRAFFFEYLNINR